MTLRRSSSDSGSTWSSSSRKEAGSSRCLRKTASTSSMTSLWSRSLRALTPRGIDGIFFFCEDCEENHFYEWDILAANMKASLQGELAPVHEPGAEPNPARYVPWDYALGYLDGMDARY